MKKEAEILLEREDKFLIQEGLEKINIIT